MIEYIDPQLDPKLFTAKVRITLENANEELRPNQLLSGNLVVPYSLSEVLHIPKSALLWTGEHSFVYVVVETDTGSLYELRSIHVGPETIDGVIVHSGLNEGDVVVSAGTFVIDAASQLQGLASMAQHSLPDASTKKYVNSKLSISNQNSPVSIINTFEAPLSAEIDSSLALYLSIKNGLIEGEFDAITEKIGQLSKLINSWESDTTENGSMIILLSQTVQSLAGSTDIITSRINFVAFSGIYIDFIKTFNNDEELFVQFCPMANEGKGAYWLSQEEQIKNPYYGAMMLRCGEMIERI